MFFRKLIAIDTSNRPGQIGIAALTFAAGLAGTMLLTPAAVAASHTVGTGTALTTAIATDANDAGQTSTTVTLSNDITTDPGTVFVVATDPISLTIDTGASTLALDGAGTVWDTGTYGGTAVTGGVSVTGTGTGGLTVSNDALFEVEGTLNVSGELTVSSGGQIQVAAGPGVYYPAFLSFNAGDLNVTGSGSNITTNYFAIGRGGDVTVTLDGGATINSGATTIGECCGSTQASSIIVSIDGANTVWDAGSLLVAGPGTTSVTVSNGATLKSGGARIGVDGADDSMLVTGVGSSFLVDGELDIGGLQYNNSGNTAETTEAGTLTISDHGFVSADTVIVGIGDASATGTLIVDTGGTLATAALGTDGGNATATFDDGTLRATADSSPGAALISGFASGALGIGAGGMFVDSNGFDVTVASGISGVLGGALTKEGLGTLTLTAANSYDGPTHVTAGTLAAGAADVFSAISDHDVSAGAALDLQGFDQTVASLDNAGTVSLGGAPGTVLSITDAYDGDGIIIFNTALGDDSSVTDRVDIGGDATGNGSIKVNNVGGAGAQTNEGIKLIDVTGTSGANFALLGDYVFEGDQAVVGGAYAYRLYQGSTSDPGDGDWYLRSALIAGGSDPLYQAGVPLYESYASALGEFNQLGTLQQRVGNRSWTGGPSTAGVIDLGNRQIETGGVWGRIEGARSHDRLDTTAGPTGYDADLWRLQAGLDGVITQNAQGVLVGGAYLDYGSLNADIASMFGDGRIATVGYGIGGTLTWYDASGFYLDGVAQVHGFDSTLNSTTAGLNLVNGNQGFGYAASIEAGSKIALGSGLSITPQVQLAYNQVGFAGFADAFGSTVTLTDGAALAGRVGLSVDYESAPQESDGSARTHLYAIANLYYDFDNTTGVDVSGVALAAGHDRLAGGLGLGGSYNWDEDKYSLYGEASVRTGLDAPGSDYSLNGNVGLKVRW